MHDISLEMTYRTRGKTNSRSDHLALTSLQVAWGLMSMVRKSPGLGLSPNLVTEQDAGRMVAYIHSSSCKNAPRGKSRSVPVLQYYEVV